MNRNDGATSLLLQARQLWKNVYARVTAPFRPRAIGVALANQPRLLREMLARLIDNEPDLRVVVSTGEQSQLVQTLNQVWVDWVVTTVTDPFLLRAAPLPFVNPGLSFIAISHDAQYAEVVMPDANGQSLRRVISNLTLEQLFTILRRQDVVRDGQ